MGKVPATPGGWKDATADEAKISEWEQINPRFNWAVACGLSGLFVIDIDPAGLDWWANLLTFRPEVAEAVAATHKVKTPRGGLHVYFRGEGPSTASKIAPGIDTRGGVWIDGKMVSGGYVVLPGSATNDGSYEDLGGDVVALPECIRALVPERRKVETTGLDRDPGLDQPRNVAWATNLLKSYVESGRVSIEGQGGNNLAFQVVASVLDKAISPALCFDLLWEHWNPHCAPPWDDWELEILIRNALAHGEETGRGAKGFQSGAAVFAGYATLPVNNPPEAERSERDRLKWLHIYADSVHDPAWLIPNYLPAQGTGMIYGPSGSYKSFLALDMALCAAFGHAGQWGAPPVKNDVLFLAGEGPVATSKKRWPAWMEWQGLSDRTDHRFVIKNRVPFYTDSEGWEQIKEDLREMQSTPALIVIDTLARLLTGMDENSAKDATMVTSFMEGLARHYGCFVLAVHHEGKDGKRGARGSSAFLANLDMAMSTYKRADGTELRVRKQKDADVPDDPTFFKVREVGSSIVLERAEALAEEPVAGRSRHDWASPAEIARRLQAMGGSISTGMLAREIADEHGINYEMVKRKLLRTEEIRWMRQGDGWSISGNSQEYDL